MNDIDISIIAPIYVLNDELSKMTQQMMYDIKRAIKNKKIEFIIVDNASTHGVKEMQKAADVYIRNETNRGWGGGINEGMKVATGKYFIFANNDITIKTDNWPELLIQRFESNKKIGAISINSKGGFGGSFFAIRKEIYDMIGEFDEKNFPLGHAQDCDYLYRLMYEGWDDNVLLIDGFHHYCRRTYNQKEFKDKYATHKNFGKSDFLTKWGFIDHEWEKRGHADWRKRIEENLALDRFNELHSPKQWLSHYNYSIDTVFCTFLGRPVGQTFTALYIWEQILTQNKFKRIVEFGTWKGNLSLYLFLFCLSENAEFYTYDKEKMTSYCENKGDVLKNILKFDDCFEQLDIFANESKIGKIIQDDGQTILFCDNGKKIQEFNLFAKYLKKGDIIGTHDWDTEIYLKDIQEVLDANQLEMIFEKECADNNTMCRFFKKL